MQPTERTFGPSTRRLIGHAGLLWLLLLLAMPLAGVGQGFVSPDEGIVEIAIRHLDDHGSWRAAYPLADIDPEGRFVPLNLESHADGQMVTYPARPVYIQLNRLLTSLAGVWGPAAFGALAVATTSLLVALTTRHLHSEAALPALWLCGVGTPLLFNSYVLQGHPIGAVVAAAVGYIAVTTPAQAYRRSIGLAGVAAILIALGCLVRRETLFVAIAALAWALWRSLERGDRSAWPLGLGASVGAVMGIGLERLAMRITFGTLEAVHVPALSDPEVSLVMGRLLAIREALLLPSFDESLIDMIAIVGLVLVLVGAVLVRMRSKPAFLVIGLILVSSAPGIRALVGIEGVGMVPGLLPAAPVLVAGLILVPRSYLDDRGGQYLAISAAVVSGTIIATQYPTSWDWGGRFFMLATPSLAALAALGWKSIADPLRHTARPMLLGTAVTSVLVMAVAAVGVQRDNRITTADLVEAVLVTADDGTIIASGPVWLPRFDVDQLGEVGYAWARVVLADLDEFVRSVEDHHQWSRVVVVIGRGDGPPIDRDDPNWSVSGPTPLPTINPLTDLWILDRRHRDGQAR